METAANSLATAWAPSGAPAPAPTWQPAPMVPAWPEAPPGAPTWQAPPLPAPAPQEFIEPPIVSGTARRYSVLITWGLLALVVLFCLVLAVFWILPKHCRGLGRLRDLRCVCDANAAVASPDFRILGQAYGTCSCSRGFVEEEGLCKVCGNGPESKDVPASQLQPCCSATPQCRGSLAQCDATSNRCVYSGS